MFTWICPQCGREVPPSYTECPDCKERAKQAGTTAPPPPAPEPPPPAAYPPPQPTPHQQYQYAPSAPPQQQHAPPAAPPAHHICPPQQPAYPPPPPQAPAGHYAHPAPPHSGGMRLPVWLMTVLFAFAIAGIVFGINYLLSSNRGSAGT